MKSFYSNGKLLLTGEYLVLDGSLSLAIPTTFGQTLTVEKNTSNTLHWISLDVHGKIWFEDKFVVRNNTFFGAIENNHPITNRLSQLLNRAKSLNPDFLNDGFGYTVTTKLDFPQNWGLGTSSTLVNNIGKWAAVNPYLLLESTFGGSGYDIACAEAKTPITYQLQNSQLTNIVPTHKKRDIQSVDFDPDFKNSLYFVHLNQKKNSRDGIAQYRRNTSDLNNQIKEINQITRDIIDCKSLEVFQELINHHENIISKIISQNTIKKILFDDFDGSIKSLGAWGGDFILVASKQNPTSYFENKGYSTIITYDKLIYK